MIELYPAIDLRDGRCVRLRQGEADRETRYSDAPLEVAEGFAAAGARWLHMVDLDAAFGSGSNRDLILEVADRSTLQVQTGGGLRSLEDVAAVLDGGARRAILGTAAVRSPELAGAAVDRWGADRIVVGLDARGGEMAVSGWTEGSGLSYLEVGRRMHEMGIRTAIYTEIDRDGMGTGPDVEGALELHETSGLDVIVSGGIGGSEHLEAVRSAAVSGGIVGVVVGRALYEGDLEIVSALSVLT